MIELKNNQLVFTFPEVHPQARLAIEFQRTLRIPDDGPTLSRQCTLSSCAASSDEEVAKSEDGRRGELSDDAACKEEEEAGKQTGAE